MPGLLLIPALALASPAEPYLRLGVDALSSGDRAAAARFLDAAVELEPGSGDALYYLSRVHAQADIARAISLLELALGSGRFDKVPPSAARLDLAALLVRLGRYEQSLRVLDGLTPPDAGRVEPFRLTAAALLGLGREEAALSAIEAGLRRHAADPALHLLRARALRAAGRPVKEALELAAMVAPGDTAVAAERALAAVADGSFRLEGYASGSGGDPRVFAQAFAASPDATLLERFFASGGNLHVDLLAVVARAASRDVGLQRSFQERVAGFTGRRWIDENRDTVAEEIYEYQGGALRSWAWDSNQDLAADVRFELGSQSSPGSLAAGPVRYEYGPYPYLARVSIAREAGTWTFELPPRRLQGPFVEGAQEPGLARLRLLGNLPEQGTLAMVATAVGVSRSDGSRARWLLEAGLPVGLEEDGNGDGQADYFVTWRDGRPSAGRRDMDGDGVVDVLEFWSARGLERIEVDLNHNGIADYTVDVGLQRWLWDYDEDGKADRSGPAAWGAVQGSQAAALWPSIIARKGDRP